MLEKIEGTNREISQDEILEDYRLVFRSRQVSLIGRREVLSGKAKFGIFGDGKELAQIALAKFIQPGDFRSGYYRDQTLMFATGEMTIAEYFAQLYADPDLNREPATGGRSMNAHFSSRLMDSMGRWKDHLAQFNTSPDVSPTASQMPRLVGLAYASRLYRNVSGLRERLQFSSNGNEIAIGTIGNASIAEGMFWESLNAISVLQSPAVISIWDDDYGISVSNRYQFGKDLAELLKGFSRDENNEFGYRIYTVKGWDYFDLINVYEMATKEAREDHIPAIVHVVEMTQPQGHSTSGSHERYKSQERLKWEADHDCLHKFRDLIIHNEVVPEEELLEYERQDQLEVEKIRERAWENYKEPLLKEISQIVSILETEIESSPVVGKVIRNLERKSNPLRKDILEGIGEILRVPDLSEPIRNEVVKFKARIKEESNQRYGSHLYSESRFGALNVREVKPVYSDSSPTLNGFEILNKAFDSILSRYSEVIAFGEDLGKIGGVNQGFAGLQQKFGELRVSDTGIREATIIGQAIGMAMRGLRPIAEIQYLDYLLYALQIISDDLATVRWRSVGGQKAPVIIRTRGHRLEGIWHSGSLLAGIINLVRGLYVFVPRNMVQAAAFYNTLLQSDDPGLIIEALNGYRLKEKLPDNISRITIPPGVPEIIREGKDVSIVTYGPLCKISLSAADILEEMGVSVEVVDVRSLLPFDRNHLIVKSLEKTNRILFLDEDVPGGTTAYMMQKVLEEQGGYFWLDSAPRTLTAKPHRPAYGTDGNYFSKPNQESIIEVVYAMMREAAPERFPKKFS